jgi:hypothetical protein
VRSEKSEHLAIRLHGFRRLVGDVIVLRRRSVVDVTTQEVSLAFLVYQSNWMIFVSALPAEMNWIQPLIGVFWQELLAVYYNGAEAWWL